MTVEDQDAFEAGHWDWTFSRPCFDYDETGVEPGDVDGFGDSADPLRGVHRKQAIVHRPGHFLLVENKPFGGFIKRSQQLAHPDFVKGNGTVVYLFGKQEDFIKGNPNTAMRVWREGQLSSDLGKRPANLDDVKKAFRGWFVWANAYPVKGIVPIETLEQAKAIIEANGFSVHKMGHDDWLTRSL